ncbi:MAG: YqaA family protein [Candidatus Competibacterales bacterium]
MIELLIPYLFLALVALGAAIPLPFYAEPVLLAMLATGDYSYTGLWLAITVGNTGGAVINWWLGRHLHRYKTSRWFPVTTRQLERAMGWFQRYGFWSLLFSWSPIGGDVLTMVAGLMRVNLGIFVTLVAIGRGGRYAVIIAMAAAVGLSWDALF